mgnify:CR=1 FL=1
MRKIAKYILTAILMMPVVSSTVWAASAEGMEPSGVNINDVASLQRGAKLFVNYCLGCHSVAYMRYNRLAEDLDLSEEQVMQNLVTTESKFGETMSISMDPEHAKAWFGKTPPDLSLTGRSRGADWIYAYLLGFYQDESGGWNNTMLPNASMPHVLWQLQGIQTPIYRQDTDENGMVHEVIDHFEVTTAGSQSAKQYKKTARDIAAFLDYAGEPAKLKRKGIGVWVILFLVMFTLVAYLLKAEYWRDVH